MAAASAEDVSARLLEVSKAVVRARRKAARRVDAVAGDLATIDEAEALAARAPWLITAAAKAKRGEKVLQVDDYSTGEAVRFEVPLDPAKSAREQVEGIFAEARRLRRGREAVLARLARSREEEAALAAIQDELAGMVAIDRTADPEAAAALDARLEAIEAKLRKAAPAALRPTGVKPGVRLPYREYVVSGELHVFVGRDAKSNDELTLHVARPHHVWLHAKGHTGSHVVACVGKGHSLTAEQLVDCAHLAAHFSDARGEGVVEISYLPRRYLRKPRKSPPGAVVLDREKVLLLRVDDEKTKALLATRVGPNDPAS